MHDTFRRLFVATAAVLFAPIIVVAAEAETAREYSPHDIADGSTVAIASQDICGFKVDQKAIWAFVAEKAPDTPWYLFEAQIRGYQRIMPRLAGNERVRHCAKARQWAEAAGWIR